tara:strand:+ start:4927 stop:5718 length:792 start_codon:yes stop_codon:yes gene_type:complete
MSKKIQMLKELKRKYEEDENGRAFGALAEAYRKSGQVKKAIQLIKKHIADHNDYTLAYLTLARCYIEIKKETEAFELLTPIVDSHKENLILQETYGDLCAIMGLETKAIEYFKRVLFYKPKDKNISSKLKKIEEDVSPVIDNKAPLKENSNEWKQVNLMEAESIDKPKNGFMSYFDSQMKSFDSTILDNLSVDLIRDQSVSDESVLTELTLSSVDEDTLIKHESKNNKIKSDIKTEEIILEKVNTFLALLCSRRESVPLRKVS